MSPSPAYDTCLAIADAFSRLQRKLDDELGTFHGLGLADLRLLTALADAPESRMTAGALAAPLGVAPSAVLRQVLALEKTGWIERTGDDARRWIALRPPGRRVQREAAETAASICTDALGNLPPDTMAGARATCDVMRHSRALELCP